ncbi:molybdopterin-dependent oxidoreductase [Limobrevibacterium gyesilva]|uniref:Molybdopterin-dependent oxidoreductase n=1 Tax=Limobrevibacterium gyesilva TaxID=2991712 RepID=A0AA41YIV7_9PROT|nr:molybdopterin-dependent oxidoreductase [Limobrevibacterium gyesilva]MCW3474449.1 molybdopterin-dependent oxidoreductase [Limobrevibacterium gyesilva]
MRRRSMMLGTGAMLMGGPGAPWAAIPGLSAALPEGTRDEAVLAQLPGKKNLIKLTWRPPNYETPLEAFRTPITPNDRFFVRYHLAVIPEMDELRDWSLTVGGDAAQRSVRLTMNDLRSLPAAEVVAVCQCSGNRRGLFSPHVPGVEWGVGAMGNARWRGARLRDVLARAGIKPGAVEVAMAGADGAVLPETPHFAKSIPLDRALEADAIIAYQMNGAPLPHLNGFPARIVIPGWTATYWMKHVTSLELRSKPLDNFWMQKAYRVPRGMFPVARPFATQDTEQTSPITEIVVNSLVTNLTDGARVPAAGFDVQGIAWDNGSGIKSVELSRDGGESWKPATLGQDLGRYAFRPWSMRVQGAATGAVTVMVRATSNAGAVQPAKLVFNPSGYHHNVIQTITLAAA